ncbi:V-type ATP synthase subunit A [Mangrovibacterium sp.]|uniref:V-type ATP synthase subunit A n=1 Tax=Mangrovibacterium sp. TaxID=1961364 RepID=UPI003567CF6A
MENNSIISKGKVTAIVGNLVEAVSDGPLIQNGICFFQHNDKQIMGEVIKTEGSKAFAQVFESTRGFRTGMDVQFLSNMLEVYLGPGMLTRNYDGLQNDLDKMNGVFLEPGARTYPLDNESVWDFTPVVQKDDTVDAGDWLGEVPEYHISHKIMVPFKLKGTYQVSWIAPKGKYKLTDTIARIKDANGDEKAINMVQTWPVKMPILGYREKLRPGMLFETGVRVIDTMNPILEGGTGFIPGPFGSGKTVLQHALAKQAAADVVIIAACGERANEVVEIFTEFPHLDDPRTGRKLVERTVIIANTSNMPVAAREASVYTAMTIAEYYRAMGLRTLLLADSTSRWAQALREMSNRMEELPGPDAFPMDLSAIIASYYSRAGFTTLNNGKNGSITFIGTVSPAGGNLLEPVTESTKKVARCFFALSQNRADSKRYPAIDPIDSYSKYLEYDEYITYAMREIGENWIDKIDFTKNYLIRGQEVNEQINILGDDGVPVAYHEIFWKSELIDFAILQQDAFDAIDSNTPLKRQKYMLEKVIEVVETNFEFEEFNEVRDFFKKIINLFKQLNYSEFKSSKFDDYERQLEVLIQEKTTVAG